MNRRCILQKDCENLKTVYYQSIVYWKLHQNECIKDCPSGYKAKEKLCVKCQGPCPKGQSEVTYLPIHDMML